MRSNFGELIMHINTPSRSRIVRHVGLVAIFAAVAVSPLSDTFGTGWWQLSGFFYVGYLLASWANDGHRAVTVLGALLIGISIYPIGVIVHEATEPSLDLSLQMFAGYPVLALFFAVFVGLPVVLLLALVDLAFARYGDAWARPQRRRPSRGAAKRGGIVLLVLAATIVGSVGVAVGASAATATYNDYTACTPVPQAGSIQQDALYQEAFDGDSRYYVAVGERAVWVQNSDVDGKFGTYRLPIINQTRQNGSLLVAAGDPADGVTDNEMVWLLFTDEGVHISDGQRPTVKNSAPVISKVENCDGIGVEIAATIRDLIGKP